MVNKRISVYGCEAFVNEDDFYRLLTSLEKQGIEVEDLDGFKSEIPHEKYHFFEVLIKADDFSDDWERPSDVRQFSEKCWEAANLKVKEYFLKNFGVVIKTPKARIELKNLILDNLKTARQCRIAGNIWHKAEKANSGNFSELEEKSNRDVFMKEIRQMAEMFEEADKSAIDAELSSLETISFLDVPKDSCKICEKPYDFTRFAF